MTVAILDTSVLCELLRVPGKSRPSSAMDVQLKERVSRREQILLPVAVLIETGNHIAHAACSGGERRTCAERFVLLARSALDGATPFTPTHGATQQELREWLREFPDLAMRKIGLADASLIALWTQVKEQARGRRVYIWSLDDDLRAYDTG